MYLFPARVIARRHCFKWRRCANLEDESCCHHYVRADLDKMIRPVANLQLDKIPIYFKYIYIVNCYFYFILNDKIAIDKWLRL